MPKKPELDLSEYEREEAEREARRKLVRDETGDEPPCPYCKRKRVRRSDYIRCCRCGMNWGLTDDLSRDPRGQDRAKAPAKPDTKPESDDDE